VILKMVSVTAGRIMMTAMILDRPMITGSTTITKT
jgi:hypothetical protein